MKIAVWFLGSNGAGKTTQSKMLHSFFANDSKEIITGVDEEVVWKYTRFGSNISNIGIVNDNQCCGTDTLSKKEQISTSYERAINDTTIVVVDGIMATSTWIDFIKKPHVKVLLVLLDYKSLSSNISRIVQRRANKKGIEVEEVEVNEKTHKNVEGKINGFRRMFEKLSDRCDLTLSLDADMDQSLINKEILKKIRCLV